MRQLENKTLGSSALGVRHPGEVLKVVKKPSNRLEVNELEAQQLLDGDFAVELSGKKKKKKKASSKNEEDEVVEGEHETATAPQAEKATSGRRAVRNKARSS